MSSGPIDDSLLCFLSRSSSYKCCGIVNHSFHHSELLAKGKADLQELWSYAIPWHLDST